MKIKPIRKVQIPILGPIDHNAGPYMAIGGLMIAWSNNESVFMAMLQALVGDTAHTATLIWHSHRTSRARMELLDKLAREQLQKHPDLVSEIQWAIKAFKGLSRLRNYLAHATYHYDDQMRLHSTFGVAYNDDGAPLKAEQKLLDAATMNEIGHATIQLATLNAEFWALVPKIEQTLGVQRVKYPQQIGAGQPSPESRPTKTEGA